MPIIRTYACDNCMHMMDVMLEMSQVDDPPPECPRCHGEVPQMRQEFKPVALGGSTNTRARDIADQVATDDYHVSDWTVGRKPGDVTKVKYRDTTANVPASNWSASQEVLLGAVAQGRAARLRHGSGLDVLQHNIKTGVEPDLIANSKRRMIKLW